jgi:hypothetical protein
LALLTVFTEPLKKEKRGKIELEVVLRKEEEGLG